MEEKRLYQIWRICGFWRLPLIALQIPSHWDRRNVISIDLADLQKNCDFLNEMADSDECYEIHEIIPELDALANLGGKYP